MQVITRTSLTLKMIATLSLSIMPLKLLYAGTFTDHADYASFVNKVEIAMRAVSSNTTSADVAKIDKLMESAQYKENVLRIMSKPGESKDWFQYYPSLISKGNIAKGIAFANRNSTVLARAEKEFGVPQSVILGIIGVETAYGGNKGSFRIIDSLATLAFFDTRRRDYFTNELIQFIVNAPKTGMNPLTQVGSYAGAIGYPQFMPTSIGTYAVDYNQDGVIDLSNSATDAIGSVANYLAKKGWQRGGKIGTPANFIGKDESLVIAKDLTKPVSAQFLLDNGLKPTYGTVPANTLVNGIKHIDNNGPIYWITYPNFQVITTYNKSRLYATAVWKLGEAVQNGRGAIQGDL